MATTILPLKDFNRFAHNTHSQHGEDGILAEIINRLDLQRPSGTRYCVEFGAWDGLHLSNTYNLIKTRGYHAVLIEPNKKKYKELCSNLPDHSITKVNAFVELDGKMSLDSILERAGIPMQFDLLSIDIDGNDYHILRSVKRYRPVIVCIEYNPTIPNEVVYVQPADSSIKRGASAAAIVALASSMGYAVVASTLTNLILLDRRFLRSVGLETDPPLQDVRVDGGSRTFVFVGYDGKILLSKPLSLIWHNIPVTEQELQVLPNFLRKFPDDYGWFETRAYKLYTLWRKLRHSVQRRLS